MAKDLASHLIHACATVEQIPQSKKIFEDIFPDLAKSSDGMANMVKRNVLISKSRLVKVLKLSKRVLERVKVEEEDVAFKSDKYADINDSSDDEGVDDQSGADLDLREDL